MYTIRIEQSFDSAHFLAGYGGKCSNIHGHRWRVVAGVCAKRLPKTGQLRGMVEDFRDVKHDLGTLADAYDHALLYERGSLKNATVEALASEGFHLVELALRPTAENLAKMFYERLKERGHCVNSVEVYETPNNCAVYTEEE